MEIIERIEGIPNIEASLVLCIDINSAPDIDDVLYEMNRFLINKPNRQCVPVFLMVEHPRAYYKLNVNLPINHDTIQFLIEYYSTKFFTHFSFQYDYCIEEGLIIDLIFSDEKLLLRGPGSPILVSYNEDGNVVIQNTINIQWCHYGHIVLPDPSGQMHCRLCQY